MKKLELCGEIYYKFEEIKVFIGECEKKNRSILSLEFFQIIDGKVIPYSKLQGIDSVSLYDETRSDKENASICNAFIKNCIDKYRENLEGMYFTAITESSNILESS